MKHLVGQTIGGYRLEAVLGRGGMGVVFRARHLRLDQLRALKLVREDLADDPDFVARFEREARIAAALRHPNVITVHDAREEDDRLFLVMELVEGYDLAEALRSRGRLPVEETLGIAAQVAAALDAAHARELVHRDVKPANVLLEPRRGDALPHAYLTDFGLTKAIGSESGLTGTGGWLGTVDYVAPEQLRGGDVDGRTDVYAFGCLLHQCLTGTVPFKRERVEAAIFAHLSEPPPRLSDTDPALAPLDAVVLAALAKDPADRPATAGQVVEAARAALAGEEAGTAVVDDATRARAVVAEPPRPRETAVGPAQATASAPTRVAIDDPHPGRRRAVLIAGVAAVLVAAGALGLVLAGGGGDDGEPRAATDGGGSTSVATGEVETVFAEEGSQPTALAEDDGDILLTAAGTGELLRADASDPDAEVERFQVGENASDVADAGERVVVLTNDGAPTVAPDGTVGESLEVDTRTGGLASDGDGTVWAISDEDGGRLLKIDGASGNREATLDLGALPTAVTVRDGAVWVTLGETGEVVHVEPDSAEERGRAEVGGEPTAVAAGDGAVWVARREQDTLVRLDAGSGEVTADDVAVDDPRALGLGGGALWVADGVGTLVALDPATGDRVHGPVEIDDDPTDLLVTDTAVFIAHGGPGTVSRLPLDG